MFDLTLNANGEPATYNDCISNAGEDCQGDMVYSENINTGRSFLRCTKHAEQAYKIHQRIHAEYLNDTVPIEDY